MTERQINDKCYACKGDLKGRYRVMIYSTQLEGVYCCSESCAEETKSANALKLYDLFKAVDNQVIQVIKREDMTPEEKIKRFIERNKYTYKVEDILRYYKEEVLKGYQTDFDMDYCIEHLESEIRELLELDNELKE